MSRLLLLLLVLLLAKPSLLAEEEYQISIKECSEAIKVDGQLNESCWESAHEVSSFYQNFPSDTSFAGTRTAVRMTYDDRFLYVGAICYDDLAGDYVIQSLKRDFSFPINDGFAIFLDPFSDKTNGFSFSVNPMGVQRDGILVAGGEYGVTTSWDTKWFSEVSRHGDHWVVEIAIPFRNIRFKENVQQWNVNFSRNDLKRNETSTWVPVPRQFNVANLSFTGKLIWDKAPANNSLGLAVIPYARLGVSKDYEAEEDAEPDYGVGVDAKVAVTSSLNLDITVNPDFSQVEVDRQVIDLNRFEIFFPERRTFFLENSDMFRLGAGPFRPFFSRRIGSTSGQLVPILFGARLSGNIDRNWRIGAMTMQTRSVDDINLEGQNYGALSLQRKLLSRSYIRGFLVNRQGMEENSFANKDYNRILGGEFVFRSENGKWLSETFLHYAMDNESFDDPVLAAWDIGYTGLNFGAFFTLEHVGKDYVTDVGFVPDIYHYDAETGNTERVGYLASYHDFFYRSYREKSSLLNYVLVGYEGKMFLEKNGDFRDYNPSIYGEAKLMNNSVLYLESQYSIANTLYPTAIAGNVLPVQEYTFLFNSINFTTPKQKRIYGEFDAGYGGFFNADRLNLGADLTYRAQPWGNFSLSMAYNKINFPEGFNDAELFLLGPRVELSFTPQLFFSTFLQYNTQAENFNVNSRFQWRFRPMSDFFLVYTDNYDTEGFGVKNRALVAKGTYWF